MARILTVASQKGGVGKTTTSVNLAASLASSGKRTLLVDLDPQGNASSGVGISNMPPSRRQGEAMGAGLLSSSLAGKSLITFIQNTKICNLGLIASSHECSQLDLIKELQERGLSKFRAGVHEFKQEYEFILIDCPPSLGGLPTMALSISDEVLIPVQCEYYAMEGLSQILPVIQSIQNSVNANLKICGLLLTMYSEKLDLSVDVVREVSEYFGDAVFRTIIPRDVVLAEAASHGAPAFTYAPLSRGAWSYLELAKEVLDNERS